MPVSVIFLQRPILITLGSDRITKQNHRIGSDRYKSAATRRGRGAMGQSLPVSSVIAWALLYSTKLPESKQSHFLENTSNIHRNRRNIATFQPSHDLPAFTSMSDRHHVQETTHQDLRLHFTLVYHRRPSHCCSHKQAPSCL